jgi:hypothetical protein
VLIQSRTIPPPPIPPDGILSLAIPSHLIAASLEALTGYELNNRETQERFADQQQCSDESKVFVGGEDEDERVDGVFPAQRAFVVVLEIYLW